MYMSHSWNTCSSGVKVMLGQCASDLAPLMRSQHRLMTNCMWPTLGNKYKYNEWMNEWINMRWRQKPRACGCGATRIQMWCKPWKLHLLRVHMSLLPVWRGRSVTIDKCLMLIIDCEYCLRSLKISSHITLSMVISDRACRVRLYTHGIIFNFYFWARAVITS